MGRTATSSVVLSSLFVILADVILVKLIVMFFHEDLLPSSVRNGTTRGALTAS